MPDLENNLARSTGHDPGPDAAFAAVQQLSGALFDLEAVRRPDGATVLPGDGA